MFRRYLHRTYGLIHAVGFRGRRRFTRAGALLLWCAVFAAGLGIDTNFSMAYQALPFLLIVLLLSIVWGSFSRARFAARRVLPRYGTVGAPLPYRIEVRNLTNHPQRRLTVFEDLADPRPTLEQFKTTPEPGEEERNWFDRWFGYYRWRWLVRRNSGAQVAPAELPPLGPHERIEFAHTLLPQKRGALQLTALTLAWPDPLGLFRGLSRVECRQTVVILPKRYYLRPLALPGVMKYQRGGVALALSVGESEEFVALRDYRPGDPLRRLHWRSWAKTGQPIVKEFADEFFVRHALILDTFSADGDSDAFEEAVAVAASFACTVEDQESLLDLLFVGPQAFCFTAGRGLAHPQQMLEILAAVTVCRDHNFGALESLVMEHVAAVSGCVCIFLAWDAPRQRLVERLKFLGIPVMVLVVTPPGADSSREAWSVERGAWNAGRQDAPTLRRFDAPTTGTSGLEPGPLADCPECLRRLEVGKVAEGLAAL